MKPRALTSTSNNTRQIENYDNNFEHGVEKFLSMILSFSTKSTKMVIYIEIHKIFFIIELIKTMVCPFNCKVNHSIFIMDPLHECLVKMKEMLQICQI